MLYILIPYVVYALQTQCNTKEQNVSQHWNKKDCAQLYRLELTLVGHATQLQKSAAWRGWKYRHEGQYDQLVNLMKNQYPKHRLFYL